MAHLRQFHWMYTYVYTSTQLWVFNSAASSPVCQSSGSGDDLTTQEGSGGLRGEGGAWHGVGRPPSSLSHGSLRKQVAAPEQRLRKRVRGSAFLTPRLPHAHRSPAIPFSLYPFLSTSCFHFPVSLSFSIYLAIPAPFHHPVCPIAARTDWWGERTSESALSAACLIFHSL